MQIVAVTSTDLEIIPQVLLPILYFPLQQIHLVMNSVALSGLLEPRSGRSHETTLIKAVRIRAYTKDERECLAAFYKNLYH